MSFVKKRARRESRTGCAILRYFAVTLFKTPASSMGVIVSFDTTLCMIMTKTGDIDNKLIAGYIRDGCQSVG